MPIILLSIWYTVVALVILMVSPDVVDIGSEYSVYLSCVYIFGWLCRAACSVVATSMLGVSHAVQNEKKLWKFTQIDR